MEKIYLQKIEQHNLVSYVGKIDPRNLIKVAAKIGIGEVQDAQRPLSAKRVKEIAKYVENKGILPNTLTIATKDTRFEVQLDLVTGFYYIEFPSDVAEFVNYEDAIDVLDGQHRLYSFLEEHRQISDNDKYEIGFTLYICPTLNERRQIFISCNEKQEKVSGNLLMWFKERLQMLSNEEKQLFDIVSKLNVEYPLKGRIIMSAEKVSNGIKAKELMNIIKQAKICNLIVDDKLISVELVVKLITIYLRAWENVVGFKFAAPLKKDGAAVKQAGLRYMLLLLPTLWYRAIDLKRKFDEEFVKETLNQFISTQVGVLKNEFFTCDENKFKFRDRSVTEQFATDSIEKIKTMNSGNFNPLA